MPKLGGEGKEDNADLTKTQSVTGSRVLAAWVRYSDFRIDPPGIVEVPGPAEAW